MRNVSNLLWPAGAKASAQTSAGPVPIQRSADPSANSEDAAPGTAEPGDDHAALRKLLRDTGHQLDAIDGLKDTFGKLVEPLNSLLSTLEREKADNARSQDAFAAIRSSHEMLRAEFQGLERKSFELERENEQLRHDLEMARRSGRDFEDDRAKLRNEVEGVRIAMSVIVRQLGEETGNARALSGERELMGRRAESSDKRAAELEAQAVQVRERIAHLENDKNALQAALDRTLAESSRNSQRLGETEGALSAARARVQELESGLAVAEAERNSAQSETARLIRQLAESQGALAETNEKLRQLEGSVAAVEAERNKLAAGLDDANERRQKESHELRLQLHELRSRFHTAEKFLAEARQSLETRAADAAATEAKLLEATLGRSEAEKKVEQLSASTEDWQRQIARLECEVANLTDRYKSLSETIATGETSLVHANEKIRALTGQIEQVRSDSAKYRGKAEQALVQLNAALELERRERARAEAALERARGDYARLQRVVVEERSTRRSDHQRRVIGNNSAAS